jgi:hypothetical protein
VIWAQGHQRLDFRGQKSSQFWINRNLRSNLDDWCTELNLSLAGTPPPPGAVAVTSLAELVTITGTAGAPVTNVTFRGVAFTGTKPTYLDKPFKAPSGGDWSFADTAAVVAEGTQGFTVDGCALHQLGGNALLLRGWNRNAAVVDSDFDRLGDSAIVSCGKAALADLSALDVPANTRIEGNIFSNVGIEVKQAGGLHVPI